GREVGLAHRNSTAVHGWTLRWVVYYLRAVRIVRPCQTGWYYVAVRVECNAGSVLAEALPHDEVGSRNHASCTGDFDGHRMGFNSQSQRLDQLSSPISVRRAIARRIIGRDFDQRSQKVALCSEAVVDNSFE